MAQIRDDNDDALRWGADLDDPSYLDSDSAALDPEETDSDADTVDERDDAAAQPASTVAGSVLLVVYGVIAGAYALFTVGWIIAIQSNVFAASNLFTEIMFQLGEFLAIASPAAWFAVTMVLTRERGAIARVGWLILGIVVVAPWPFIVAGAAA